MTDQENDDQCRILCPYDSAINTSTFRDSLQHCITQLREHSVTGSCLAGYSVFHSVCRYDAFLNDQVIQVSYTPPPPQSSFFDFSL